MRDYTKSRNSWWKSKNVKRTTKQNKEIIRKLLDLFKKNEPDR